MGRVVRTGYLNFAGEGEEELETRLQYLNQKYDWEEVGFEGEGDYWSLLIYVKNQKESPSLG